MNTKNQKPENQEPLPDHCPDLTYEEVAGFEDVLDDYLELCMEIYWQRVADGTFPWPADGTVDTDIDADISDSTL